MILIKLEVTLIIIGIERWFTNRRLSIMNVHDIIQILLITIGIFFPNGRLSLEVIFFSFIKIFGLLRLIFQPSDKVLDEEELFLVVGSEEGLHGFDLLVEVCWELWVDAGDGGEEVCDLVEEGGGHFVGSCRVK